MSVKVPYESVEYQSHHHCQCDFCNSRRAMNAKKFAVSRSTALLQSSQQRNNCLCACHDKAATCSVGANKQPPSFELDDPEHHVNQTALNAKMGRTGLPGGDKYTVATGYAGASRSKGVEVKSREEEEAQAMEDLDRLERLLILEHKARVKTVSDAEKLRVLQSTGKGPRPRPFDVTAETVDERNVTPIQQGSASQTNNMGRFCEYSKYCSIMPQTEVEASHQLQHVIDDVRKVTRDPANRDNAASLRRVLHEQGVLEVTPTPSEEDASRKDPSTTRRRINYFGPRPEGAGVVWRAIQPSITENVAAGVGGIGNADNRDLWKTTLVKGGSVNSKANITSPNAAAQVSMPPGAKAAIDLQQTN